MGRRFFWSMALVAVVTLTLGGVTGAVLINRSVDRSIRSEFARQASATARIIESRFFGDAVGPTRSTPPPTDTVATTADVLALVGAIGGHDFVEAALIGPRGTVTELGAIDPVLIPLVPDIESLERAYQFDADVGGGTVAAVAQPFRVGRHGTLVVVIGTNLELIPWPQVLARFAWAIALGIVLAAVLAGALARRLSARVEPLQEASRAFADGDFTTRVVVEGSDELSEVGRAFNEMATQLEAARTREREFLVSVSHDLRTPLTTITGYAEAMQEGRVGDDDLTRVAGVLATESGRLRRLVEDLMQLSRIEAREFSLRPEQVDLAAHLTGVLEGFSARAEAARVELRADLDTPEPIEVDPDRVAQVVGNLLENALRYTPEAGAVTVSLRAEGGGVRIAVADTGPGIDPADLPHIWERLYVTARYRPVRPEGSGLGLSIVRELVVAMGGSASVESTPGHGTTIVVTLPGAGRSDS